jgi:hypothetical protein
MNKEFIPYEQSLELKELGFDEPCFAVYIDKTLIMEDDWLYSTNQDTFIESSNFTAPLYQQAFRWFREKYGIMYTVDNNIVGNTFHGSYTKINSDYESDYTDDFATYEEAELACLKKLIEIVKTIKPC